MVASLFRRRARITHEQYEAALARLRACTLRTGDAARSPAEGDESPGGEDVAPHPTSTCPTKLWDGEPAVPQAVVSEAAVPEADAADAAVPDRTIPPSPYALSGTVLGPSQAVDEGAEPTVTQQRTEGDAPVGHDRPAAEQHPTRPRGLAERLMAKVPLSARDGVVDPGRRALGALLIVGVLAASVAGVYLWRSRPEPAALPPRQVAATGPSWGSAGGSVPPATAASIRPSPTPTGSPRTVVVDVAGKVRDPGVYTLPSGSRVVDAVRAAGGARKGVDTTGVNLARLLVDGEKILVGVQRPPGLSVPPGAPPAGDSAASGTGAVLDLNTATAAQLQELPGIGPVLSERIVAYRTEHGAFGSTAELKEVSGIGDATFSDLEDRVRV